MADRKAVHSLLIDRPYGEIVATMDWAYRSTGRRCCAPRYARSTSRAPFRRRRARYARTTNATTPPTTSQGGAGPKPPHRLRRYGHERGRESSRRMEEGRRMPRLPQPWSDYLWSLEFEPPSRRREAVHQALCGCLLILVENILPKKRSSLTPPTTQRRNPTHENSNSAQFSHLLFPSNKNGGLL